MRPEQSPFPAHWWGIDLDIAGLGAWRPDEGTYTRHDLASLPLLPCALGGSFDWLAGAEEFEGHIGEERAEGNRLALPQLLANAEAAGIALPADFLRLVGDEALQASIRSTTDCMLDLGALPIPSPLGSGHLVRFLADSQGCLFWYLHITPEGESAVVVSPDFYGAPEELWQDHEADAQTLSYCAESVEAFACRFWVENELWFAASDEELPPKLAEAYRAAYLQMPPTP